MLWLVTIYLEANGRKYKQKVNKQKVNLHRQVKNDWKQKVLYTD